MRAHPSLRQPRRPRSSHPRWRACGELPHPAATATGGSSRRGGTASQFAPHAPASRTSCTPKGAWLTVPRDRQPGVSRPWFEHKQQPSTGPGFTRARSPTPSPTSSASRSPQGGVGHPKAVPAARTLPGRRKKFDFDINEVLLHATARAAVVSRSPTATTDVQQGHRGAQGLPRSSPQHASAEPEEVHLRRPGGATHPALTYITNGDPADPASQGSSTRSARLSAALEAAPDRRP